MNVTLARSLPPTRSLADLPTPDEWDQITKPTPGEGDKVVIGRRKDEPLPASMADVKSQLGQLNYQALDPFVSSVGGSIGANQVELPKGERKLAVPVPGYYNEDVNVLIGTQNGPNVPMLVILPGIHSDGASSHNSLLKKLALERGMNYVCVPNSMSQSMLDVDPVNHPGNPRVDAQATRELLSILKERLPDFFSTISVAGYSYGALQGANLVRLDEESSKHLINGSLVAFSPPENLAHSMRQLDGLRASYQADAPSQGGETRAIADTGLKYKHDVKKYGYDRFGDSDLSQHAAGSNTDEIQIADKYGSRDGLQNLVQVIDKQFHHNLLPTNTQAYQDANQIDKFKMRQEEKNIVDNMTYDQLSSQWLSSDNWLQLHGLTPEGMADKYSFGHAMEAIHGTPVLTVTSADDYILNPTDVQTYRDIEAHPQDRELLRVFDTGGHVGLDWNPRVAETAIDFAAAGAQLHLR